MGTPNSSELLFASIAITDITAHTYRTDPFSTKTQTGIQILPAVFNRQPPPGVAAIVISNTENEELTAAVIGNIDTTQAIPDYTIGTGTIAANASDILYVYMQGPNAFPSEYISLSLSFATAPTTGNVLAYLKYYEV